MTPEESPIRKEAKGKENPGVISLREFLSNEKIQTTLGDSLEELKARSLEGIKPNRKKDENNPVYKRRRERVIEEMEVFREILENPPQDVARRETNDLFSNSIKSDVLLANKEDYPEEGKRGWGLRVVTEYCEVTDEEEELAASRGVPIEDFWAETNVAGVTFLCGQYERSDKKLRPINNQFGLTLLVTGDGTLTTIAATDKNRMLFHHVSSPLGEPVHLAESGLKGRELSTRLDTLRQMAS